MNLLGVEISRDKSVGSLKQSQTNSSVSQGAFVQQAGGYMLETLPDASEETEKTVIANISKLLARVSNVERGRFGRIFFSIAHAGSCSLTSARNQKSRWKSLTLKRYTAECDGTMICIVGIYACMTSHCW